MSHFSHNGKEIKIVEWQSLFVPEARYIGFIADSLARTGRQLLSFGRTPAEAALLSQNKLKGAGIWKLGEFLRESSINKDDVA